MPMTCEHSVSCSIIRDNIKIVPFIVKMIKIKYCELNKNKCARYKVLQVLERDKIPPDLWPTDEIYALVLIEEKLNETYKRLYWGNRGEIPA
jgi:hypothetical protein